MKEIGFDIISDLYLDPDDNFNWEGKATSLYCIVAGNITNDTRTLILTLTHLSKFYQGVFFTIGPHDLENKLDIQDFCKRLSISFDKTHNIKSLYENVIVLDGVAILGVNGWIGKLDSLNEAQNQAALQDITYLYRSIQKLQKHSDIKKILVVSACVPGKALYFGEEPEQINEQLPLQSALQIDTEFKVTNWVFGGYEKIVDTRIEGIHYVNNPYYKKNPYWAKRITIMI